MISCCFFGHRDSPDNIRDEIEQTIINLIVDKNVTMFYVGNNGSFDSLVKSILKNLKERYTYINYYVVLSYIPIHNTEFDSNDYSDTIYPDELEKTPLRFAIVKRNDWMLKKSTYVITYAKYRGTNAYKLYLKAKSKEKIVINIAESIHSETIV